MKKFLKSYGAHIVWALSCIAVAVIIFCIKPIPDCIGWIFIGFALHFLYDMIKIIKMRKDYHND